MSKHKKVYKRLSEKQKRKELAKKVKALEKRKRY